MLFESVNVDNEPIDAVVISNTGFHRLVSASFNRFQTAAKNLDLAVSVDQESA